MKKIFVFLCFLLIASFAAAQTAPFLKGPFDEAIAQAQKENKLILVDFFQKGG